MKRGWCEHEHSPTRFCCAWVRLWRRGPHACLFTHGMGGPAFYSPTFSGREGVPRSLVFFSLIALLHCL